MVGQVPAFVQQGFLPEQPPRFAQRYWQAASDHYGNTDSPVTDADIVAILKRGGKPFSQSAITRCRDECIRKGHPEWIPRGITKAQARQGPPWLAPPVTLKPADKPDTVRICWSVKDGFMVGTNLAFEQVMRYRHSEVKRHPAHLILRPDTPLSDPEMVEITTIMQRLKDPADPLTEAHIASWLQANPKRDGPRIEVPDVTSIWNADRQRHENFADVDAAYLPESGNPLYELHTDARGVVQLVPRIVASLAAAGFSSVALMDLMDGKMDGAIHWCRVLAQHAMGMHL